MTEHPAFIEAVKIAELTADEIAYRTAYAWGMCMCGAKLTLVNKTVRVCHNCGQAL